MTYLIVIVLVLLSGLFSGLTLGLLSLDKNELERKIVLGNKKAKKVSKKKAKAKYGELIDTSSKKEFIKNNGEVNYNKAMDSGSIFNPNQRKLNKIRKAKEAKYSRLK